MVQVLRTLRESHALRSFRMWLVGSRVEPGRDTCDIDLLLSGLTAR